MADNERRTPRTTERRARARDAFAVAAALGAHAGAAVAADGGEGGGWLGIAIVVAIVAFVAGLGLQVWRNARMSPGWRAFIERRRAEGRPTTWREWDDDEKER